MATESLGRTLLLSSRVDSYSWWRNYVRILVMTILTERMIGEIALKIIGRWITENESSKVEGVYRIFDINSVVRITTTSVDGVHACNICTKNSYLLRAGRSGFQDPAKARFSVPTQRGPDTHSTAITMRAGCLSRGKMGRYVALTTNPFLAPGSSVGRAKPVPFSVTLWHITGQLYLYVHIIFKCLIAVR
jgi:hypothetical protein